MKITTILYLNMLNYKLVAFNARVHFYDQLLKSTKLGILAFLRSLKHLQSIDIKEVCGTKDKEVRTV